MALVISPRSTKEVIDTFVRRLDLKKVPNTEGKFWHGNFNDSLYEGLEGLVKVLFPGYSGAVAGQALIEYADHYLPDEEKPEVYFVGSVYAFRDSDLELGDIAYARDTFSPDSFEQSIYTNAKARGVEDITLPDPRLLAKVQSTARCLELVLKPAKVHCSITPGHFPGFTNPSQLMDDGMWWKLSLNRIPQGGCDSGEYESAAVLASSRLFNIPAVALLDVKDKIYSPEEYKVASGAQRMRALSSMLDIVRLSVLE
jgi:purine-nucleoside phosphorylase